MPPIDTDDRSCGVTRSRAYPASPQQADAAVFGVALVDGPPGARLPAGSAPVARRGK